MALYDSLFGLMDLQSAQVLVTSNDFVEPTFKENLCATVEDLLSMSVVPVFNENDAISDRSVSSVSHALQSQSLFKIGKQSIVWLTFCDWPSRFSNWKCRSTAWKLTTHHLDSNAASLISCFNAWDDFQHAFQRACSRLHLALIGESNCVWPSDSSAWQVASELFKIIGRGFTDKSIHCWFCFLLTFDYAGTLQCYLQPGKTFLTKPEIAEMLALFHDIATTNSP